MNNDVKVAGKVASDTRKNVEKQLGHSIITKFDSNKVK